MLPHKKQKEEYDDDEKEVETINTAAIKLPHGALFSVYQNCNYHRIYVQKTGNENIQAKKQAKPKRHIFPQESRHQKGHMKKFHTGTTNKKSPCLNSVTTATFRPVSVLPSLEKHRVSANMNDMYHKRTTTKKSTTTTTNNNNNNNNKLCRINSK
jgi:hypothetical protein